MKALCAEFIGTFWLVLGGCGSAVLAAAFPDVGIGLLGVAFAFGLTVLTYREHGQDGFFLVRIAPPAQTRAGDVLPKDIAFGFAQPTTLRSTIRK